MATGRELIQQLEPAVQNLLPKIDELCKVMVGVDNFEPIDLVWPDTGTTTPNPDNGDPMIVDGVIEDKAAFLSWMPTQIQNMPPHDELMDALQTLLDVPGDPDLSVVNNAVRGVADQIKGLLSQYGEISDEIGAEDKLNAFNALNQNRPADDYGVFNSKSTGSAGYPNTEDPGPSGTFTPFGFFPAITQLAGVANANALLGPLETIANAVAAADAYAIFGAYATAVADKLIEVVTDGVN